MNFGEVTPRYTRNSQCGYNIALGDTPHVVMGYVYLIPPEAQLSSEPGTPRSPPKLGQSLMESNPNGLRKRDGQAVARVFAPRGEM